MQGQHPDLGIATEKLRYL